MKREYVARQDAKSDHIRRTSKRRLGFSTVVGAIIMIAAVSILGSIMLIWANSHLNAQQKQIGDYYETTSNSLKETYVIEDVWLYGSSPNKCVDVTIRNVGSIAIQLKSIAIVPSSSSSCTASPLNGVILAPKGTYTATVPYNWSTGSTLDISVNTQRGSIERILWKA